MTGRFWRFADCAAGWGTVYSVAVFFDSFHRKGAIRDAADLSPDPPGLLFVPAHLCRAAAAAAGGQHGSVHDFPLRCRRRGLHRQRQPGDERGGHRAGDRECRHHHSADPAHWSRAAGRGVQRDRHGGRSGERCLQPGDGAGATVLSPDSFHPAAHPGGVLRRGLSLYPHRRRRRGDPGAVHRALRRAAQLHPPQGGGGGVGGDEPFERGGQRRPHQRLFRSPPDGGGGCCRVHLHFQGRGTDPGDLDAAPQVLRALFPALSAPIPRIHL